MRISMFTLAPFLRANKRYQPKYPSSNDWHMHTIQHYLIIKENDVVLCQDGQNWKQIQGG